ncbi:hypothetical protein [Nonomuraea sp. NPDC049625]|uniref:hypothetical protein n=1 Tax=Nonomuraea sp. NPDC049625 TaxID=3155775 RepID=UPI003435DFD3
MRTFFEPDREEEFEAAKDLLIRRCLDWADDCGLASDDLVLTAALDSRHRSRDGRLASGMPRRCAGSCWSGSPGTSPHPGRTSTPPRKP